MSKIAVAAGGHMKKALFNLPEDELVTCLVEAHKTVECARDFIAKAVSGAVQKAVEAGYVLEVLRSRAGHGEWLKYVDTKLNQISRATVYRYLSLAERYPDIRAIPKDLSLTELYGSVKSLASKGEGASQQGVLGGELSPKPRSVLCRKVTGFSDYLDRIVTNQDTLDSLTEDEEEELRMHMSAAVSAIARLKKALQSRSRKV